MHLCFGAMPWLSVDTPSLAIGIMRARIAETHPAVRVSEFHGGIAWAAHLLEATGGELTPDDYSRIADGGLAYALGDWVFAGALYDDPNWRVTEFRAHAEKCDFDLGTTLRMRELAGGFVSAAAARILDGEPDIVGLTTTFMQTVPSLALARELKRRSPGLRVVLGGANCDGAMGHAIHRNHPFVDFVVRGEGEQALPALLTHLDRGTDPADVPGLCWWDGTRPVANPVTRHSVPPALIPMPDYDEWFAAFESSRVREFASPMLFLEGSRGCWWGEKHQCTFCGLNGAFIAFRSKPAERFWQELSQLVTRHRVLDVMTADNIIDMAYYPDLLPRLAATGWALRIQYEAKANVRAEQIAMLSEAGVCAVQYGIENLNSNVLALMDKGVTAGTNVRVLRDSEDHHMTVRWNYLYGFPGETADDYLPVVDQMPALVHLQPPNGATRIALERFSPYFERPELGFGVRRPARPYRYVYDLPEEELADLVYFFDCEDAGITGAVEDTLIAAVEAWRRHHRASSLFRLDGPGDALTVRDRRHGWAPRDHVFSGWRRVAYEGLDRARSSGALRTYLGEHGHDVSAAEVDAYLAACMRDGLTFADRDTYVALATRDVPVRISARQETPLPLGVPARPRVWTVPGPVPLDASRPEETLAFVARLRDAVTETVDVSWQAVVDPDVDSTLLHHLPPPAGDDRAARRWQDAHRPAQCYYRVGPGFLQIKDARVSGAAVRLQLDEPELIDTFTTCLRPTRLAELAEPLRAAAAELLAERLLMRLGDWVVALPSRSVRWPVPSEYA